ncbi:MAG: LicD family protein [Eubacterium sp.]|nr:LicD family protein [Eubacterium sp.]
MLPIQNKILVLLKEIDDICRENDIDYYLAGGTLIGAMRHKGFIPWDDDADIIMTRKHFMKFIDAFCAKSHEGRVLKTQYFEVTSTTVAHYAYSNDTHLYRQDVVYQEERGTCVDIVLVDYIPNTEEAKSEYIRAVVTHTDLTLLPFHYGLRYPVKVDLEKYFKMSEEIGIEKTIEEVERKAFSYSEEESELLAQCLAGAIHFWKKEDFGKPVYVPFEDTMLPIPQNPNAALVVGYNEDWYNLPSMDNVENSTHEHVVEANVGADKVYRDFNSKIDYEKMKKLYIDRKIRMHKALDKHLAVEFNNEKFAAEYVRMVYDKKRGSLNLMEALQNKKWESIEEYFKLYIDVQCTNYYLGAATLSGWKNWYRKQQPILIDIGDIEVYVCLELLVHKASYRWANSLMKARNMIDRILTPDLETVKRRLELMQKAADEFYMHKDNECERTITELLNSEPENLTGLNLKLNLKERKKATIAELIEENNQGLALYPNDCAFKLRKGWLLLLQGSYKEAYQWLDGVVESANNGVALLHLREIIESLKEELTKQDDNWSQMLIRVLRASGYVGSEHQFMEEIDDTDHKDDEEVDDDSQIQEDDFEKEHDAEESYQKAQTDLLKRFDGICRSNQIEYSLWGRTLFSAVKEYGTEDLNERITVAMTYDNAKKFYDCVQADVETGYCCRTIGNDTHIARPMLQYVNENLVVCPKDRSKKKSEKNVYIEIEVLCSGVTGGVRGKFSNALIRGWYLKGKQKGVKDGSRATNMVKILIKMFGRKKVEELVLKQYARNDEQASDYLYMKLNGKTVSLPKKYFEQFEDIALGDLTLRTTKNHKEMMLEHYGTEWEQKKKKETSSKSVCVIDKRKLTQAYDREDVPADFELAQKRLEILWELDRICRKEDIKYTLWTESMLTAVRSRKLEDVNSSVTVAMTNENVQKFRKYVEENVAERYYCDDVITDRSIIRPMMKFGDKNSTFFPVNSCGKQRNYGVHVIIGVLYEDAAQANAESDDIILGWYYKDKVNYPDTVKVNRALDKINDLIQKEGREQVAQYVREQYDRKEAGSKYYCYMMANGKTKKFPKEWFDGYCDIMYEGHLVRISENFAVMLKRYFGKNWIAKKFNPKVYNRYNLIIVPQLPYHEYVEYLQNNGIDLKEVSEQKDAWIKESKEIRKMTKKVNTYWLILNFCGERYQLQEIYAPKKQQIMNAYQAKDWDAIDEMMAEYEKRVKEYLGDDMGLVFDREIYDVLIALWSNKGLNKRVQHMQSCVKEEDFF